MKEIIVLNGSPREKSNTMILVDSFIKGYKNRSGECRVVRYDLRKMNINPCCGCYSCWQKTPGRCIFNDPMDEILSQVMSFDLVIWATPLYHFSVTWLLKTVIERTLPVHMPHIRPVEKNGKTIYTHPHCAGFAFHHNRHILISNCGFPEQHNFKPLKAMWDRIVPHSRDNVITCVMGELFAHPAMHGRLSPYLTNIEKAGEQMAA